MANDAKVVTIHGERVPSANDRQALAAWIRYIADAVEKGEPESGYDTVSSCVIILTSTKTSPIVKANGPHTDTTYGVMGAIEAAKLQLWEDGW